MNISPLYLAALAVAAIDGLDAVGTRGPNLRTADYQYGGVLDARGRQWVVKYPLHTQAATTLEAEASIAATLLEQLRAGNLSFDVMRPAGFAQVETGRALVYPTPMGKVREFDELDVAGAHELGRALAAIHGLPHDTISDAGMPVYDSQMCRRRLLTELHDVDAASALPFVLRRRWENALEQEELWDFTPRVVHGDVAADNFLWSEGSVSCVLGFGEAHVGDPAHDFSLLVSALPEELFDAVYSSYANALTEDLDESFFQRTVLISELALPRWYMFGKRHGDHRIMKDAQQMLDELAAEVESDPELAPGPTWKVDQLDEIEVDSADEASFTTTDPDRDIARDEPTDRAHDAGGTNDLGGQSDDADSQSDDDGARDPR